MQEVLNFGGKRGNSVEGLWISGICGSCFNGNTAIASIRYHGPINAHDKTDPRRWLEAIAALLLFSATAAAR